MAPGAWEPLDKYPNDYIIRYNPQEKGLQQEGMTIIPTQTRGAQAVLRGPPLRTPTLPGADPLVSGCLSLLRVQVILDSCTKITGATCPLVGDSRGQIHSRPGTSDSEKKFDCHANRRLRADAQATTPSSAPTQSPSVHENVADAAIAAMQQSNPSKAPVEAGGAFEASKTAIMAIANQFQGAEVEELMISPLPNRQVVHENIADTAIAAMRQSIPSAAPIETGGAFEASKTATMAIANQFQGAEVEDLEVPPLPERVATLCACTFSAKKLLAACSDHSLACNALLNSILHQAESLKGSPPFWKAQQQVRAMVEQFRPSNMFCSFSSVLEQWGSRGPDRLNVSQTGYASLVPQGWKTEPEEMQSELLPPLHVYINFDATSADDIHPRLAESGEA
ncbi:hypothetical protein IWZ00DRAFT_494088 [Phyllosticta capitalensis]|uniref:WW domain-containing protein n=1 Tax=Phyllosticta capitalensis TaxID=121624 RepID=A0ABR1YHZ9_9PEZI